MRNIIGVLFYVLSGIFVYMASFLSFTNTDVTFSFSAKLFALGVFILLAIIPFAIGLLIKGLNKWQKDLGIVLISGAGAGGAILLMLMYMLTIPEMRSALKPNELNLLGDYYFGGAFTILLIFSGILLLQPRNKSAR